MKRNVDLCWISKEMIRLSVLPSYRNCLICSDLSILKKNTHTQFVPFWGVREYLILPHVYIFYIKSNILKMYKPNKTTFSTGFMLGWCHLWLWRQVFCWGRIIKSKLMGWPSKQGSLSLRSTLVIVAHYPADWICRKASTCGHIGRKRLAVRQSWPSRR